MATINSFINRFNTEERLDNDVVVVQNEIDFSVTNASADDVVQVLRIPDDAVVLETHVVVVVAEGGTATADLGIAGDASSTKGFDEAIDLNAAAGTVYSSTKGTDAYAVGLRFTADGTIDLIPDNDLDTAKIKVFARYYNSNTTLI